MLKPLEPSDINRIRGWGFAKDTLVLVNNEDRIDTINIADYIVSEQENLDLTKLSVTTSNRKVAFYYEGEIAAVAPGQCTVTAEYQGMTCQANVIVLSEASEVTPTGITYDEDNVELVGCDTFHNRIIVTPAEAANNIVDITYSSSDASIATVSSNGLVTAVSYGDTVITATAGELTASYAVHVSGRPLRAIAKTTDTINIKKGKPENLKKYLLQYPSVNDETDDYSYLSSDESVATVSSGGTVTGHRSGQAVITISKGACSTQIEVVVEVPLNGIKLNRSVGQIESGKVMKLAVRYDPEDTTDVRNVTWSSNKKDIATVDKDGRVTGKSEGIATITAKVGSLSATCRIIVSGEPSISVEPDDNGGVAVETYDGDDENIVIPDKVNGQEVTSIGANAFSSCDAANSVELPETIKHIDDTAFNTQDGEKLGTTIMADAGSYAAQWAEENGFDLEKLIRGLSINVQTKTYTYAGDTKMPSVVVTDLAGVPLEAGRDYEVEYTNNKNVGTAGLTVRGINGFRGELQATFVINPKGVTQSTPAKAKKSFTAKWKKSTSSNASGYQVRYSLKSSMGGSKTKTVSGYSKTSLKVKGLKAKKKYYVQVRVYKTVNGKKYYSAWSAKKSVKTK